MIIKRKRGWHKREKLWWWRRRRWWKKSVGANAM